MRGHAASKGELIARRGVAGTKGMTILRRVRRMVFFAGVSFESHIEIVAIIVAVGIIRKKIRVGVAGPHHEWLVPVYARDSNSEVSGERIQPFSHPANQSAKSRHLIGYARLRPHAMAFLAIIIFLD
jgi:hypothetical protein